MEKKKSVLLLFFSITEHVQVQFFVSLLYNRTNKNVNVALFTFFKYLILRKGLLSRLHLLTQVHIYCRVYNNFNGPDALCPSQI